MAKSLIGKIVLDRQLPSKKEIIQGVGNFLKNPVKGIKEGIKRDKFAVETTSQYINKPRTALAKMYGKAIGKGLYKGGGKDLLVNTGGLAGSIAGGHINPAVSLAGDYFGARLTRRQLNNLEANFLSRKIIKNQNFLKLPKENQRQILKQRKEGFLKKIGDDLEGDRLGFAIGNGAAATLGNIGVNIPLRGAAVALASVNPSINGIKVYKKTNDIRKGLETTKRRILKRINPQRAIKRGNMRENKMYQQVNQELHKLPELPNNIEFNRYDRLSLFFQRSYPQYLKSFQK